MQPSAGGFLRDTYNCSGEHIEESIAKIQHLPRLRVWRLFWKRADGNWHRYQPCPQADSLADALRVVDEDAKGCFFGWTTSHKHLPNRNLNS